MQTLTLAGTGRKTTQLGYGCSSLMGSLGRRESVSLLEAAYDAGFRHFDVAPMYGYGEAEACLGEFLVRHRDHVTVTTKYGIAPAKNTGFMSFARRFAGPIIKSIPALKQKAMRAAAAVSAPTLKASYSALEARASLERSLTALQVDRVDVWLMHDAMTADLGDPELLEFLQKAKAEGKIGAFGVGTEREAISALLAERPQFCGVLQNEWSVLNPVESEGGAFRIHHRSLSESFQKLRAKLASAPEICERWSRETDAELARSETLAALMLKASLEMNSQALVLVSSKNPSHLRENVRVAGDDSLAAPARKLYALVQAEGGAQ